MKQLILKHGQSILTSEQKKHIIDTGKMPEINTTQTISEFQKAFAGLEFSLEDFNC